MAYDRAVGQAVGSRDIGDRANARRGTRLSLSLSKRCNELSMIKGESRNGVARRRGGSAAKTGDATSIVVMTRDLIKN